MHFSKTDGSYLYALMFKFLFAFFIFYLLYKFVFGFIIPIYNNTRHMREQIREMQQKQHRNYTQQSPTTQPTEPKKNPSPEGDYIDFEEIK